MQVDDFIGEVIQPILDANAEVLGRAGEVRV